MRLADLALRCEQIDGDRLASARRGRHAGISWTTCARSVSMHETAMTACLRSSIGSASISELVADSSIKSVNSVTSARFERADRRERELVVAVDLCRLEVEQRPHDALGSAPPRRQIAEDRRSERDHPDAVTGFIRSDSQRRQTRRGRCPSGSPSRVEPP